MTAPTHLRTEDESEFERLVHQALCRVDVHHPVHRAPGEITLEYLHDRAMEERHTIAAAAATEYRAHSERREAADRPGSRRGRTGSTTPFGWRGFLAAVVILTPVPASAAAVLFLALGYGMSLRSTQEALAGALTDAGQTALIIASILTTTCVVYLLFTVAHHHSSPTQSALNPEAELQWLHESWRQAHPNRGILPSLHDQLRQQPSAPDPEPVEHSRTARSGPKPTTDLGYTGPRFSSPRHHTPSA